MQLTQLFLDKNLEEITNSLANYLPNDKLFAAKNIPNSNLRLMLTALAVEIQRLENTINGIAQDFDPRQTQYLIREWEMALGIPDSCFTGDGTDDERRRDIVTKIQMDIIITKDDYIALAAIYGYAITISYDVNFPFNMYVNFPDPINTGFDYTFNIDAGGGDWGFLFNDTPGVNIIQCLFAKLKPANYNIVYTSG